MLNQARILVTRPAHQAQPLCDLIEQADGIAVRHPCLEIVEVLPNQSMLRRLPEYDWLIFISANAVNFALKAIDGRIDRLTHQRIGAVGKATAKALQIVGLRIDSVPESDFNSEALLSMPGMQSVINQKIAIVRGIGGREKLADTLKSRGAQVDYLEVYRRIAPQTDARPLHELLERHQLDAVTVTSAEALENLQHMLQARANLQIKALPLIVMSDRIKQIAEQAGFINIAVTEQPSDAAILQTLIKLLTGKTSGRSN